MPNQINLGKKRQKQHTIVLWDQSDLHFRLQELQDQSFVFTE